jgi:hypothetical protein
MVVSFYWYSYEFQAILSVNLCRCITADQTLTFLWDGSVSVDIWL